MLRKFILAALLIFAAASQSFSQGYRDVVYLRNGSIVKGIIVEQVPNQSLKIKTADGSVFVYQMADVQKIAKEAFHGRRFGYGNMAREGRETQLTANKKGYKGFVDLGFTFNTSDFDGASIFSISTTHGYQFNPHLFVGGGIAPGITTQHSNFTLPVFADVRGTFMNNHIAPFADLKVGYSVADLSGFYLAPSVGVRFAITDKLGVNASLGYEMTMGVDGMRTVYVPAYGITSYSDTDMLSGVTLKVGLDF